MAVPLPLLLACALVTPQRFEDPAPPRVAKPEPIDAPAPEPYDGLRIVAAPRPLAADAIVEDWPGFLGPRRDGRSRETKLEVRWPDGGPRLCWSMERGEGYASPSIVGQYLVYPHRIGNRIHIDCVAATTGERYWRHSYPTDYRGRYIADNGQRSTPSIDGDRVYVHGVDGRLLCLELTTGRVIWQRDLDREFELGPNFFGVVSSPLVVDDMLVVNVGAPRGPSVAAFDKRTGKLIWGSGTRWGMSCASPVLATVHGVRKLFVIGGGESRPPTGGLMVLDPGTGELDFEYPFRSRTYESVLGASPVVFGSRVFLTASYNTGSAILELDADGGFDEVFKTRRLGTEFATALHVDGHLYTVDGVRERAGAIVCLDAKSGVEVSRTDLDWEDEVVYQGVKRSVSFSLGNGCLIRADGRFLCLTDWGHLLWLDCTPAGARVLARASLFRAVESWTPPVVCRGLLYVCQNKRERIGSAPRRLLCYDLRASE